MKQYRYFVLCLFLLILAAAVAAEAAYPDADPPAGGLSVLGTLPAARSLSNSTDTTIGVLFDRPVDRASIHAGTFMAFGKWSGPVSGAYSFANGDRAAILTPAEPFAAGEMVMVVLSNQVKGADGSFLRSAGYSFVFWTRTRQTQLRFSPVQLLSTRSNPNDPTQAYGGVATDLNNDGWLDLTIVNEITADLRVFLNRADGSGRFNDFIEPTFPAGNRASPIEPSDFNGDGNADVAVANIDDNSISILLGNGDGTFAPQQEVAVGRSPRGVAILDADGDGDADVVNTNSFGAGSLSLLVNNGNGVFNPPINFEGGATGEWAVMAADMNEDGIMDLVVGAQSSSTMLVLGGNGDGTFTQLSSQSAGGAVWMINVSDLNGDGHDDVATVNSSTNNGAILFGDGLGNLSAPTTYNLDPFPLATDLGDMDGDGDLDWITSSFLGDWWLLTNNGQGQFTFRREFPSTSAGSCALPLDIDNDGDLDLGLIDEIADQVVVVRNR
ncbi:MAG: FG-GAP-like repeat-containing protein [Chloroflexota bacterium]